jgi:hypothetical protein
MISSRLPGQLLRKIDFEQLAFLFFFWSAAFALRWKRPSSVGHILKFSKIKKHFSGIIFAVLRIMCIIFLELSKNT